VVVWTTGPSGEWRGPVRAPAAPGVERSEELRLDVKDGKRSGRRNGGRGRGPATGTKVLFVQGTDRRLWGAVVRIEISQPGPVSPREAGPFASRLKAPYTSTSQHGYVTGRIKKNVA
jgi:hypothetical protein